jgi:peptidoglycan/LPS O-acetylase OafA/YrhL
MQTWQLYLLGWIGWGIWFGVEEFWAIKTTHTMATDGTLSSMAWRLIRGRQWYHRVAAVFMALFLAWLTWHFIWQPIHFPRSSNFLF